MSENIENIDEKTYPLNDDQKIKFAKVHRPERTKTIQTIDTTGSRRPSISAPKRQKLKVRDDKKNVDIVSILIGVYALFKRKKKKLKFHFL